MRILLNPFFLLCVALFIAHQITQSIGIHQSFVDSYLDDVLCMPVILTVSTAFMRITKRDQALRLSLVQIVFAFAQVAIVFELVLPLIAEKYHGDPWDLIAYALGSTLWWLIVR